MKTLINLRTLISFMLICFTTLMAGQDMKKKSIADQVYDDYKKNGIEKALQHYAEIKKKEAASYKIDEWELNRIGYQIMDGDRDLKAAEKVFRLNMEEYPDAPNPKDSYGDYLLAAGEKEEAKKYFRESMDLTEKGNGNIDDTRLYMTSLGKLAGLEDKHSQLDLLIGNWKVDQENFVDGQLAGKSNSLTEISYDEEYGVLELKLLTSEKNLLWKKIIAYDAVDDEFDVAYVGTHEFLGLWPSTMKVKSLGNNSVECIEKYIDENKQNVVLKHEIKKINDDSLVWLMYEPRESDTWEKVTELRFTR